MFVLTIEITATVVLAGLLRTASPVRADESPALSADAVAARPVRYRSTELTLQGRVVERGVTVPDGERAAFVLGGPDGGRLLVVRDDATRGPSFVVGTTVRVQGQVVIPPTSRRLERRPASRTAVAKRVRASALVKADRVAFVCRCAAGSQ